MLCMSCNIDVPPQFIRSLATNNCPSCGDKIMDETCQNLLVELKEAMERMPNNPEGLAGWLVTNYRLTKVGDAQPTHFYSKKDSAELQNIKINNNPVNKFLQRTNAGKDLSARQDIRVMAEQIGAIHDEEQQPDMIEDLDSDEYLDSQLQTPKVLARDVLANNSLVSADAEKTKLSQIELKALVDKIQNSEQSGSDVLNADRMRRLMKQQELADGNVGKITRR